MRLSPEEFIARVLWHVTPKGRHTVRYYGLYVPNAHGKRNLARDALGYLPETPARREQAERTCPRCGHRLWLLGRHHGEFSINRSRVVQQGVRRVFD